MSEQLNGYQLAGVTAATFVLLSILDRKGNKKATDYKWFNSLAEELEITPEDLRTMALARIAEPYSLLWINYVTRNTWNVAGLDAAQIKGLTEQTELLREWLALWLNSGPDPEGIESLIKRTKEVIR
jgi:hypothetical protein